MYIHHLPITTLRIDNYTPIPYICDLNVNTKNKHLVQKTKENKRKKKGDNVHYQPVDTHLNRKAN